MLDKFLSEKPFISLLKQKKQSTNVLAELLLNNPSLYYGEDRTIKRKLTLLGQRGEVCRESEEGILFLTIFEHNNSKNSLQAFSILLFVFVFYHQQTIKGAIFHNFVYFFDSLRFICVFIYFFSLFLYMHCFHHLQCFVSS